MKQIFTIFLLLVFGCPTIVSGANIECAETNAEMTTQKRKSSKYTFEDLESLEGTDVVYVSKMMLSLAKGMVPKTVGNDVKVGEVMENLTGIHIISIENSESVKKGLEILKDVIKSGKYEIVMKMAEAGSDSVVFYYKEAEKETEAELMMVSDEAGKELSVIRLKGDVNLEKLKGLTN